MKKFKVILDCNQKILCNVCEFICSSNIIKIGNNISDIPETVSKNCIGCGRCVANCPGQACFLIKFNNSEKTASIILPFESLDTPEIGDEVITVDNNGRFITKAKVLRIRQNRIFNMTKLIELKVPKSKVYKIRGIKYEKS